MPAFRFFGDRLCSVYIAIVDLWLSVCLCATKVYCGQMVTDEPIVTMGTIRKPHAGS